MVIYPAQCRAARALVNWSQSELEAASKVAKKTIADFETEKRQPYGRTLEAIRAALEAAGVMFIEQDSGGPGVRLRNTLPSEICIANSRRF
jgi:transcriptional regulator with XRE-family HTH domain